MNLKDKINDFDFQNDWAKDIMGEAIHISQAKSGAQGYYCMGCDKEMQAVKGLKKKHYFRHHAIDVDTSKVECVSASRVYREKLAYFYFQRTKTITVPEVYKYPPKGVEGSPMLLQEKEIINAHKVEREVTFFEDENGVIHRGKNTNVDERFLWIRPDAVFFDEFDKPILFIEFVINHKPDTEKLNKLQRLGINAVQIIIPKLPEEELEKTISKVSKIKWAYNEIESNTEYIRIQSGDTEGIPFIDEEQRKLFEESFSCRAAQVGNLIRSIDRIVESESYKRVEFQFEREISRIKDATKEHQSRLDEIQAGVEREIHSELGERRGELDQRSDEFQEYRSGLEGRYYRKRFSNIEKRRDIDREIEFRYGIGKSEDDIRREFERIERCLVEEEAVIEAELEGIRNDEASILREIEECSTLENDFRGKEDTLGKEFEELEASEQKNFERETEKLGSKIKRIRESKAEFENELRSEFEGRFKQIIERINNRDIQGRDELSERIETILNLRGLFGSYTNGEETLEKCRKGIELIQDGTWKKWN